MTSSEYATVFELLGGYSRNEYQWFLSELFLNHEDNQYYLCFRPLGGNTDSPDRFACRYLRVRTSEIRRAAKKRELPASMIDQLDGEFSSE